MSSICQFEMGKGDEAGEEWNMEQSPGSCVSPIFTAKSSMADVNKIVWLGSRASLRARSSLLWPLAT